MFTPENRLKGRELPLNVATNRSMNPYASSCPARAVIVAVATVNLPTTSVGAVAADGGPEYREIHFPVDGAVSFSDDFGDPRVGHTHEGNDLMGKKLEPLLAGRRHRYLCQGRPRKHDGQHVVDLETRMGGDTTTSTSTTTRREPTMA